MKIHLIIEIFIIVLFITSDVSCDDPEVIEKKYSERIDGLKSKLFKTNENFNIESNNTNIDSLFNDKE